MPEPLTIITSCVSILSGITSVSKSLAAFIGATKGAKADAQGFHEELQSLYATVALLKVTELRLPEHIEKRLSDILQQCEDTIEGLKRTVDKHTTGKPTRNLQWALVNGDDMRRLRERLDTHVAVLEITLELANAVKVNSIKDDTTAMHNELRAIRFQLLRVETHSGNFMLQRFVQDTLTYTESVVDSTEQQVDTGHESDVSKGPFKSAETGHTSTNVVRRGRGLPAQITTPVEASVDVADLADTARPPTRTLHYWASLSQQEYDASSSRRKSRGTTPVPLATPADSRPAIECFTCHDDVTESPVAKLECGHNICTACVKRLFELSVTHPSYMPPKCCTQQYIPLEHAAPLFNRKSKILWGEKYQEFLTKDRKYRSAEALKPGPTLECSTCYNNVPEDQAAELECGHIMCTACLKRKFELSITWPSHMPPKCCTQKLIPLQHAAPLFDDQFKLLWNKKYEERSTRHPMYCSKKRCREWIPPADQKLDKSVGRSYGICGKCKTKVCKKCTSKWHGIEDCQRVCLIVTFHSPPAPAAWHIQGSQECCSLRGPGT